MLAGLHMALRSVFTRGVVTTINDAGGDQTVDIETHYGVARSAVPVHHPFGFAAHAPHDGAVTHVIPNGGDPADAIALPPSNPSVARMGNLAEGESCLYDAVGQKVYLVGGKIVRIDCVSELQVRIAGTTVLDVTQTGVVITGSLAVSEGITAQKDIVAGTVSLQQHVQQNVQPGSGQSGPPVS